MFCKYCKKEIPADSSFCPVCGHKQISEDYNLIICPNCKHKISEESVFCPYCGQKQIKQQKEYIACPNCKNKVPVDSIFCMYCGKRIITEKTISTICPVCEKEIPKDSLFCPYCGVEFDEEDENQLHEVAHHHKSYLVQGKNLNEYPEVEVNKSQMNISDDFSKKEPSDGQKKADVTRKSENIRESILDFEDNDLKIMKNQSDIIVDDDNYLDLFSQSGSQTSEKNVNKVSYQESNVTDNTTENTTHISAKRTRSQILCPYCGKRIDKGLKICPECKRSLESGKNTEQSTKTIHYDTVSQLSDTEKIFSFLDRWKKQLIGLVVIVGTFMVMYYNTFGADATISNEEAQTIINQQIPANFDVNLLIGTWLFEDVSDVNWDDYYLFNGDYTYIKSQICSSEQGNLLGSTDTGSFTISGTTLLLTSNTGVTLSYDISKIDDSSAKFGWGFMHSMSGTKIPRDQYDLVVNNVTH